MGMPTIKMNGEALYMPSWNNSKDILSRKNKGHINVHNISVLHVNGRVS